VNYAQQQMEAFHLHYSYMTCVVTDTEATMVAAGRKFVEHSEGQNGRIGWHGCVDHLLELITGIAFTDSPKTFLEQVQGTAVKPIQDVVTRWWSTYSMVEQLLRLKMYFAVLQE
jgi:hypothetical protein